MGGQAPAYQAPTPADSALSRRAGILASVSLAFCRRLTIFTTSPARRHQISSASCLESIPVISQVRISAGKLNHGLPCAQSFASPPPTQLPSTGHSASSVIRSSREPGTLDIRTETAGTDRSALQP
ncbi:hypothetical protein BJ956_000615 [Arthrobacter psychrochitiniphilus]|nr:hypothetical protein [Arthrobacter psychrochitiniphilus]